MDTRLWIILAISLFFWLLHMPSHRRIGNYNKIRVPRILALSVGSRDHHVVWRALSFQLGFAIFFVTHVILLKLGVANFTFYSGVITLLSILVIQLLLRLIYRGQDLQ